METAIEPIERTLTTHTEAASVLTTDLGESVGAAISNLLSLNQELRDRVESAFLANPANEQALEQIHSYLGELKEQKITLEGTPLYADRDWDIDHEIGIHSILLRIYNMLIQGGTKIEHHGLYDEYTVSEQRIPFHEFQSQMPFPFDRTRNESDMLQGGRYLLQLFEQSGLIRQKENGELVLRGGKQPLLRKASGMLNCPLLDSVFQLSKGSGTHVIVHPSEFIQEQQNTQQVMLTALRVNHVENAARFSTDLINEIILPQLVQENKPQETLITTQQSLRAKINNAKKVALEKINQETAPAQLCQNIRQAFHYFIQQENAQGRFKGLAEALKKLTEQFQTYRLPFRILNIFFDSEKCSIVKAVLLEENGKYRDVFSA